MSEAKAAASDLKHVLWHWNLFGGKAREGRAIKPDRTGSTSVVLRDEKDVAAFVRKYEGERIICFSVQAVSPSYTGGHACSDSDIPAVTHLFFDFDGEPGCGPKLTEELVPHLQMFCHKRGWKPWAFATTSKGLHAYAQIPTVTLKEHPDFAQRVAYLTTVVLRKQLGDHYPGVKTDSVFNLSRQVKIVGTAKPGDGELIARFIDNEEPELEEDPTLLKFLLDIRLEAPADVAANDAAEAEPASLEIATEVAKSKRLRELIADIAHPTLSMDRSKVESVLIKEFWHRQFRDPKELAKFLITLPGSKCRENGFTWAVKDVTRVFRKEAAAEPEAPDREEHAPREELFPHGIDFLARPTPPLLWLFDGILAKGMRGLLAGDPKTLKSWAAIYLMLHTANRTRDNLVIYAAGEGWQGDWQKRIRTIAEGHGFSLPQIGRNFRFALRAGLDLLERETLLDLRAFIVDEKPSLVVIDTLRSQMLGDENDSALIGLMISNLDFLVADLDAADIPAILIVHHTRKHNGDQAGGGSRIRGSSALWGHVDTTIVCTYNKKDNDKEDLRQVVLDVDHRFAAQGVYTQTVEFGDEDVRVEFKPGRPSKKKKEERRAADEEPTDPAVPTAAEPEVTEIVSVEDVQNGLELLRQWPVFKDAHRGEVISQREWELFAGGKHELARAFFKKVTKTDPEISYRSGKFRVKK